MPFTVNAFNHAEWERHFLQDFGDFSEQVEYVNQQPDFGDCDCGDWFFIPDEPLPSGQRVIFFGSFGNEAKRRSESEIAADFAEGLQGIRRLPPAARAGVFLAYFYYQSLFRKIRALPARQIRRRRVRIPNLAKMGLLVQSMIKYRLSLF